MELGDLIGSGRTARVFALGADAVVKVPRESVPDDWPLLEAELATAVRASGAPAPAVLDVVMIEHRPAIVFERVRGPSLWQRMLEAPSDAAPLAGDLARLHRDLLSGRLAEGIPDLVDRVRLKIEAASSLGESDRAEATEIISSLPRGAALLHGDLHPDNVLMSDHGPIVIDWFDAAIGHPIADVVRSSVLMRPPLAGEEHTHLPGATPALLEVMHRSYLDEFAPELDAVRDALVDWQSVVAAGRLAEGAHVNEATLLALWSGRHDATNDTVFSPG